MATTATLLTVPFDACLLIFAHLDVKDLLGVLCTCKSMQSLAKESGLWRQLAEAKWGLRAVQVAEEVCMKGDGDWKAFCQKRICLRSHMISPMSLIQEYFRDPWQHLVCCLLCSRTSGSQLIRDVICEFLADYMTPSHVLEAPDKELEAAIDPLGLQEVRRKAVKQMTKDFFAKDWKDPSEFYGCGKFASDSWRIFCRGVTSARGVEDAMLLRYLRWLNTGRCAEPAKARTAPQAKKRKAGA